MTTDPTLCPFCNRPRAGHPLVACLSKPKPPTPEDRGQRRLFYMADWRHGRKGRS